jgi:hypothetical protein
MDSDVSGALATSVLKVELRFVGGEYADTSRGKRQKVPPPPQLVKNRIGDDAVSLSKKSIGNAMQIL